MSLAQAVVRHRSLECGIATELIATQSELAALVGLGDGINRFVNSQQQWRADTYIPAYVRRYPFLSVNVAGQAAPILALDTSQAWIQAAGGETFVDAAGQATPRLARVLAFQRDFQQQAEVTQRMCAALIAAGVLEPRALTWQGADGQPRRLDGFWCVEEAKLRALSPDALHTLHQADALGLAYAQLLSMSNLQSLVAASAPAPASTPVPALGSDAGGEKKATRGKKTALAKKPT